MNVIFSSEYYLIHYGSLKYSIKVGIQSKCDFINLKLYYFT